MTTMSECHGCKCNPNGCPLESQLSQAREQIARLIRCWTGTVNVGVTGSAAAGSPVAYVFYWADALRSGTVSDAEFKRRIASGMTKSEQAAFEEGQREMRERSGAFIETEPLHDPNPSTAVFDGWYKARVWMGQKIRALPLTPRGGDAK